MDSFEKFERGVGIMGVIIVLANLAFLGVVIWGIIALVNHFTS